MGLHQGQCRDTDHRGYHIWSQSLTQQGHCCAIIGVDVTVEAQRWVKICHAVEDDGHVGCVMNGQEWEWSQLGADNVGVGGYYSNHVIMKEAGGGLLHPHCFFLQIWHGEACTREYEGAFVGDHCDMVDGWRRWQVGQCVGTSGGILVVRCSTKAR